MAKIGGDAENYMDAPVLDVGGGKKGGGGFLASLLNLLGVGHTVVQEPESAGASPKTDSPSRQSGQSGQLSNSDILGDVQAAVTPNVQMPIAPLDLGPVGMTPFGKKWLESTKPIRSFDPGPSGAGSFK